MDDTDIKKALLEKSILKLLKEGIVLSEDTLFFAESTCGLSPAEIEAALADPELEERDELLALIFTPEMGMRAVLEPLLGAEPIYNSAELNVLTLKLAEKIDTAHVLLPDGKRFNVPIEHHDIDYFVTKLYLDRPIDDRLIALLNEFFSRETVIDSRLMLRCRGNTLSIGKLDFLYGFIEKSQSYEEIFLDLFGLVLTLLAEIKEPVSIEEYLLDRRRQLIKTLREIREFERKREHYSMEYLMMQRYPVPHESQEQVVDQLQMLTTLTDAILGLPPDPSLQPEFRNLGTYGSGANITNIFRVLS